MNQWNQPVSAIKLDLHSICFASIQICILLFSHQFDFIIVASRDAFSIFHVLHPMPTGSHFVRTFLGFFFLFLRKFISSMHISVFEKKFRKLIHLIDTIQWLTSEITEMSVSRNKVCYSSYENVQDLLLSTKTCSIVVEYSIRFGTLWQGAAVHISVRCSRYLPDKFFFIRKINIFSWQTETKRERKRGMELLKSLQMLCICIWKPMIFFFIIFDSRSMYAKTRESLQLAQKSEMWKSKTFHSIYYSVAVFRYACEHAWWICFCHVYSVGFSVFLSFSFVHCISPIYPTRCKQIGLTQ